MHNKRRWIFVLKIWLCILFCFMIRANQTFAADPVNEEKVLERPIVQSVKATSGGKIKLKWKAVKNAETYEIYRSDSKGGSYHSIGSTRKLSYTDKTGRKFRVYYYKIKARAEDSAGNKSESAFSKVHRKKVRKPAERTAYAGDSIFTGFDLYKVVRNSKKQRVIAKVGVNTKSFYSGDLMRKLLNYNPDRMFIMMGVNALPGSPSEKYMDYIIEYYKRIVDGCLKKNPNMEIIVVGVSPVTKSASVKLSNVKAFNKKLKNTFGVSRYQDQVYYYSLSPVLADKKGYLKQEYSGGDGIHWKKAAYDKVLAAWKKYIKEL